MKRPSPPTPPAPFSPPYSGVPHDAANANAFSPGRFSRSAPREGPPAPHRSRGRRSSASAAEQPGPSTRRASPKRYDMKKSINLWAFPYPQRMTLAGMPATGEGRGLRWHRTELRSRQRSLAQIRHEGIPGHPQNGGQDRHRHQRPVLVPVLALSAHQQRSGEARPRASNSPARSRRRPTISAWKTCSSCPARCTSRGARTTSRCPTTFATSARRKPCARSNAGREAESVR